MVGPLSSLTVLHLKNYNCQDLDDTQENPLARFREEFKPFAASTCARHVYICVDVPHIPEELITFLTAHTSKCEYLTGGDAYRFTLEWLVGAISSKLNGNDHFVLGKIRQEWQYFSIMESDYAKPYTKFVQMLFEDARHIRNVIESESMLCDAKRSLLLRMSGICAEYRIKGEKPDYNTLLIDDDSIHVMRNTYLNFQLKKISSTLGKLNLRAGDENLLPSLIHTRNPLIGMFKRSMQLVVQKQSILFAQSAEAGESGEKKVDLGRLT